MPRLYREIPLSSIWEGSGNVMCLDVLRAMSREEETLPALLDELRSAGGADKVYDAYVAETERQLMQRNEIQARTRSLVERLALALQASLLIRHAPPLVADAFCVGRLSGLAGHEYGTLPPNLDLAGLVTRATPKID